MNADGSCQNARTQCQPSVELNGSTGGYCIARKRLSLEMVQALAEETGSLLGVHTPACWQRKGRHLKLVGSTTVNLADSEDNQVHYHSNQSEGVISLATGAVLAAAMGPHRGKGSGEHGLFRGLQEVFISGDLMLADNNYCSYFLIASMQAR